MQQTGKPMEINQSSPVISSHSISIHAPVDRIWQLLSDINRWKEWNPAITHSMINGPLSPGATFKWKSAGMAITSTIEQVETQQFLAWKGKSPGLTARHIWTIETAENGATVSTAESFEGWMARLFKGTLQKTLDSTLQSWLCNLKTAAEAGS